MGEGRAIELPLVKTIVQLLVITVIPVSIGMVVHAKQNSFARRVEKAVKIASLAFLFLVIAGIVRSVWEQLPEFFAKTGTAALALNAVSMLIGFFGAKALRLARRQAIAIGVEVGIQNGTTALLVTGTLLANPVMSIAPAIYSLIMFATGAAFAILVNIGRSEEDLDDAVPAVA